MEVVNHQMDKKPINMLKHKRQQQLPLSSDMQRIIDAQHNDPFCILGPHVDSQNTEICVFIPNAKQVTVVETNSVMQRVAESDIFTVSMTADAKKNLPEHYQLRWVDGNNTEHTQYDPYSFAPQVSEYDLHLYGEGKHWHAWHWLGAQLHQCDGIDGVLFAVWAPNATRISVIGDFNQWDGRRHPMRMCANSGVWELFIPGLVDGDSYKFELLAKDGKLLHKSDPYAKRFEFSAGTANIVCAPSQYQWDDAHWLNQRREHDWLHSPLSIYEVHLGSWRRHEDGRYLNFRELALALVEHVEELGFTHIELMPVTEHPFYGSWGYQTIGYYSLTSHYGSADDFRYLVDLCHQHHIGIIMDWVPAHFPKDEHGLRNFDGSALYEHDDPRRAEHREWDTLIFNYGRHEVRNFLIANALYWLEEFHIDGLRVDAVASMLYLDYAREDDDWLPNEYGGRENLDAIEFLKQLNAVSHQKFPGTIMMAEESTDWPMVSRPTHLGGLGFSMKWNMGWMHDILDYMSLDPVYRQYSHNSLTFGVLYAYHENFILPFSHDEVVYGKRSLLYKMSGDEWQQFANLRLLYVFMYTFPGKQLIFMGNEFGQGPEWNHDKQLDWHVLDYPLHRGVMNLVSDITHLNKNQEALYKYDFEERGFSWIDCHDASQSILSYCRKSDNQNIIVILNFTPVIRSGYRIGVPEAGTYIELLNSDSEYYGGSNIGNYNGVNSDDQSWMGYPFSIVLDLPPLAGLVLIKRNS